MVSNTTRVVLIGALAVVLGALPMPSGAQDAAVDAQRAVMKRVKPAYPEIARQLRLSGVVRLLALVTPEGKVKSVETVGGNPVLAAASEQAAKQYVFAAGPKETKEALVFKFDYAAQ